MSFSDVPAPMKLLLDFLPIILFFAVFKYGEGHPEWATSFAQEHLGAIVSGGVVSTSVAPMLLATVVVIAATVLQIVVQQLRGKKIEMMLWISLALVTVMGGATIWFHNDAFIKWKPSVLYWLMALSFVVSQLVFKKNLLRSMMGEQLELPPRIWQKLSWAWVIFFSGMGALNLFVAFNYSLGTWVNFKLFGSMGLMLAFTIAQGLYLSRHISPSSTPKTEP
jgi:intracellular septation protein